MRDEVAIRLDTEDFLTPESDEALVQILDILDRHDATATFPIVAWKLRHWERRGRQDLIRRLRQHAVGYHSATHSLHPTIAEELAPLPWEAGQAAFRAREAEGFHEVTAVFGPPACWTQPGGNWTAAALPVLRSWGVTMEFSEAWNSYLDAGDRPCHYGGLLHWSPPVAVPKPFFSQLPACLDQAVAMVRAAARPSSGNDAAPVCVVAHPTELCTTAFWDAVNFAGGHMPPAHAWRAAPLRTPADIVAATDALDHFIGTLKAMGLRFVTAATLSARFPDRAQGLRLAPSEIQDLAACVRTRAGWAVAGERALSAAEILGLLCGSLIRPGKTITVRPCDGPATAPPVQGRGGSVPQPELRAAALWCDRFIEERHAVPPTVPLGRDAVPPADLLSALARAILAPDASDIPLAPTPVEAERFVKARTRLHWDWAIFPQGFAPEGLWEQARLQAWTFKPARPSGALAGPWAPLKL